MSASIDHIRSPSSPWAPVVKEIIQDWDVAEPILLIGPVGSLQVECAKEIHGSMGGRGFERVMCTPNSTALRTQLLGSPLEVETDFSFFDPEPLNGAVQRASGGTLFLESIDRCNISDIPWLRRLLQRRTGWLHGSPPVLEPDTNIIASITYDWTDLGESAVPQWLKAIVGRRVIVLDALANQPAVIVKAIKWFSRQANAELHSADSTWSNEAMALLVRRPWPGNFEEIRHVVRTLVTAAPDRDINVEICSRVLFQFERHGRRSQDNYRRQACYDYAEGIIYMGRPIRPIEIYQWIGQFAKLSYDRRFDPWTAGFRIVQHIHDKYYYSAERIRVLIRRAYSLLCEELKESGYLPNSATRCGDITASGLRTILVNPLGPIKSAAGVLPHVAHLLGAGTSQEVVPIEEVANRLTRDQRVQMIMFCDDFIGTGGQILKQVIDVMANDKKLQNICERRSHEGIPVAMGVVVGVGFTDALLKIVTSGPTWLPVFAHAGERLEETDRAFSGGSTIFPEPEFRSWVKALVLNQVGASLSPRWPGGFGDSQSLVVTADNAPNDTLPAVWKSGLVRGMPWKALFERASSPSG